MDNLIRVRVLINIPLIFLFSAIFFGGFLLLTQEVEAQYGSCSEYGVMAYESGGYCKCMSGYVMGEGVLGDSYCISETQACQDQYGFNARANYSGGCECGYGYVFDTNYSGQKQCVSSDSMCRDEYGVMSRYDSLSGSCECSYGYSLGEDSIGRTQCISDTQACQNQLGYHATALGGQCKCSYGYVIDTNMFGDQQCTDGDQVCHSDHGYNSSYSSLSNKCECDDDYTFDADYQCVEKQHNVYFKLLDINPEDNKELLIKSDYDYSKYIIRVGIGCLSTSIGLYEGKNLVVNLGTDYEVDVFDNVVLQDHNQTCSIMSRERTYDDSFPEPEEDSYYYYTPTVQTYTPSINTIAKPAYIPNMSEVQSVGKEAAGDILVDESVVDNTNVESSENSTSTDEFDGLDIQGVEEIEVKESFFKRIISFFKSLF